MEQEIPSSLAVEHDENLQTSLQVVRTPEQCTRLGLVVQPSSHAVTTPMEQQDFLQNIADGVASKFSELACTLQYDGLDSSNPVLTISQRAVFNQLSMFSFSRVDSFSCKLWFLPASNTSLLEKAASEVKCPPCKCLVHYLNLQRKRTLEESPSKRIKRQDPSSRARLQHMSPASQQARKQYAQYQRSSNIRKLRKYEDSEVELSNEQNKEMCEVMETVTAEDLDKLYQEGD